MFDGVIKEYTLSTDRIKVQFVCFNTPLFNSKSTAEVCEVWRGDEWGTAEKMRRRSAKCAVRS